MSDRVGVTPEPAWSDVGYYVAMTTHQVVAGPFATEGEAIARARVGGYSDPVILKAMVRHRPPRH